MSGDRPCPCDLEFRHEDSCPLEAVVRAAKGVLKTTEQPMAKSTSNPDAAWQAFSDLAAALARLEESRKL
jgi:hypothetical protein